MNNDRDTLAAAAQHQTAGRMAEAERLYRQVLQNDPNNDAALVQLGQLALQAGQPAVATACFRRLLHISADDVRALSFLGQSLANEGKLAEAEDCLRRVTQIATQEPKGYRDLGMVLQAQSRLDDAIACFRLALDLNPRDEDAHNLLGEVLLKWRSLDDAADHFQEAIRINPRHAKAHANLASVRADQGMYKEALELNRRAAELSTKVETARGLSGRLEAASYYYLGYHLPAMGRIDEAIEALRSGVRLDPTNPKLHSNYVYALNFHPDYDVATIFAEHRQWATRHADPLTAASTPHTNDRTPDRRLRIGYVSAHFRSHAVNFFSEPILAAHDHAACEVYCYSGVEQADDTTRRLQGYADHWREITNQADDAVSELIRRDQIDILVDLAGHISGTRLGAFAHKPAPVQVTYIGYQNTSGMLGMDYRLTDEWSDPPGQTDAYYTEQLVRLPRTFFVYLPSSDAPPVGPLPALTNGYVTFGSFNNFAKVTPQVLATWGQIMRQVPNSRLMLLAVLTDGIRDYVTRSLAEQGIGVERLQFVHHLPRPDYLRLITSVDIALDPFPFNGHTTTCDSLWMGVPVVTLAGQTYASRFGSSALVTLGLRELIASTRKEYMEIAVRLAGDVEHLQDYRARLRPLFAVSPLVDAATFTRNLEAAYREMWRRWCQSFQEHPAHATQLVADIKTGLP